MNVRSRGLAVLGLSLLASAGVLGGMLAYDDADPAASLASAHPGDDVAVKGTPEPFYPEGSLRQWRDILPMLGDWSYLVAADGVSALLTSDEAAPDGQSVAEGEVLWVGPHPEQPDALLVVVGVAQWRDPFLG